MGASPTAKMRRPSMFGGGHARSNVSYGDEQEARMTLLWILLAFWLGAIVGFASFALMRIGQWADQRKPPVRNEYRYSTGC
jgi:hypothetical protein